MIYVTGASEQERDILLTVLETGLGHMGAASADLDVRMVGRARIRELNRDFRGVDRVTDVLSFPTIDRVTLPLDPAAYPYDVDPATGRVYIGSIVICRMRAKEQAEEYGHGYLRELSYLAAHGMLHLLSFDHMEEGEKAVMREAEEDILAAVGARR